MIIDKDRYTAHIKDPEKIITMRRIIDKIEIVLNSHSCQSTDFLDPYERHLAKSILNRFSEISYRERGGICEAERQIIDIFPYYLHSSDLPENLSAIRIDGNLEGLTHKDFLGTILSLGIIRDKIGDILVHQDFADILVKREIEDFILLNLERVRNQKIISGKINFESLMPVEPLYKEISKTLSSYRLDVFISATYNLSRQESMELIKRDYVKVNWEPIDKPSKELEVGDLISLRGYGRSILHSIHGLSKKGRVKAIIRIIL